MTSKPKLLIIKLGWSETLDAEISRTSSLGDVLRTTVVLHEFKDYHVTWLVDEKAFELIDGNPMIDRPLIFDLSSVLQLESEHFDVVINFEKVPGLCALADKIRAWKRFGFAFDPVHGKAISRDGSDKVFSLCHDPEAKRTHSESWQKILVEMIGGTWSGQEYILGYKPKTEIKYDFGLNHQVGPKWPTKSWPRAHWEQVARELENRGFTVSWQEGLANLREYMDWIHSCRNIITCDSLGFHLALAMKKRTTVLFGPTNANETYLYGRGTSIRPRDLGCVPCMSPSCASPVFCMNTITPGEVLESALALADAPAAGHRPSQPFLAHVPLSSLRMDNTIVPEPGCKA